MKTRSLAVVFLALSLLASPVCGEPLRKGSPRKLGFSVERLDRLHAGIQSYVDEQKHAGAISAIVRNGKIVDFKTYGYRDLETHAPMERDTIVRIYSMSKVITSVAVMILYEEGRFGLDDPVSRYIPELKNLKVFTGGTAGQPELIDAKRPVTIKHLLTHTAGFAYDFSAAGALKELYQKADLLESASLKEFIERLARLPLVHQPGEAFNYGVNTDVLGYLVEVVSGQPVEIFCERRIFGPLRMKDTGFDVPAEKMKRLAVLYENGPDGKFRAVPPPYGTYAEKGRGFASGGGGLFSTADDYLRFAQMLLNGGKLDGRQILGRKTVELMTANNLNHLSAPTMPGNASEGFGLGGSVRIDLARGSSPGSVGQFGWSGAATTTFNIDPREKTIALLFTQHLPFNQHGIFAKFYTLFYSSLVD